MAAIKDILIKYQDKIDHLDTELIIAHEIGKTREFVLAHPEHKIPKFKIKNLKLKISRRRRGEPLAYILGHKEFYGLDFKVNKNVLIPRPETELLVDLILNNLQQTTDNKRRIIVDIGTGSGNIIISLAYNIKHRTCNTIKYYATDISSKALAIAKQNAKFHKVGKKIKFLQGDLLKPVLNKLSAVGSKSSVIILANLPYLSPAVYQASQISVKMYEPKKALISQKGGLFYYDRLLKQIKKVTSYRLRVTGFLEISPEQRPALQKLIKKYFPEAKINFYKDLTGKWRVCNFEF